MEAASGDTSGASVEGRPLPNLAQYGEPRYAQYVRRENSARDREKQADRARRGVPLTCTLRGCSHPVSLHPRDAEDDRYSGLCGVHAARLRNGLVPKRVAASQCHYPGPYLN